MCLTTGIPKSERPLPTLFLHGYQNAAELFRCGVGANPSSLQQGLQWSPLSGLVLAGQTGAAAPGVHSTRLALGKGACHAAATAGLPHSLGAVFWQRLALHERPGVTRLASDHRPHGLGEPGECSQHSSETKHAETGHSADKLVTKGQYASCHVGLRGLYVTQRAG